MITTDDIKYYFENTESDLLFEKLFGLLPDDNDIIYEPQGLFNKGILNDIGKITKKKSNLFVEINRQGLYDILPKGLFHDKLDDTNNQVQFFDKIEKEKRVFRKLFLPFDSEVFSVYTKIEKESIKHFKNGFNSEIAFSLLKFYRIPDSIDLLSLLELLYIDLFILSGDNTSQKDIEKLILSQIPVDVSFYKLIMKLLDSTHGCSRIVRLLNSLPHAPSLAGQPDDIEKLIRYVLGQKVFIEKIKTPKKYISTVTYNKIGELSDINKNSASLILGDSFLDEPDMYRITIIIDQERMFLMSQYINGCTDRLTRLFLNYFLPFDTEFEIIYKTCEKRNGEEKQSLFLLQESSDVNINNFNIVKNNIEEALTRMSSEYDLYNCIMPLDLRLLLIEYFNLFYNIYFKENSKHAHLNMNTKI